MSKCKLSTIKTIEWSGCIFALFKCELLMPIEIIKQKVFTISLIGLK